MHEVTDLDDGEVGGQLAGLLVRAESDQLAPQLREVPADVADHRDPGPVRGEGVGRARRAEGAHDSSGAVQASIGTYWEMLSIRRCAAATSRTAWFTMLRSIGDRRSSVS